MKTSTMTDADRKHLKEAVRPSANGDAWGILAQQFR